MTPTTLINRLLRPAAIISGVVPAAVITMRLFRGDYVNPAEALEHATGFTALWYLLASLSATPVRHLTGVAAFTRLRKPLGLWSFGFAVIHMFSYLVFDQSLLWGEIGKDILKRPYITVGFTAFLILLALAVTSPNRVMKKMGGKRWRALHRLVYVAAVLGVLHFLWLVKLDITKPAIAGVALVLLLIARVMHAERSTPATPSSRAAEGGEAIR